MSSKNIKIFDETGCLSEDALVEYAHGQLGIHLKKQVEIHINECDFCRDALEGISLMESKESSRAAIAFVNAKVAGKPEPKGGKVILMNFQRLAAAVLLFFVLGGGVLYITLNSPFKKDVAINTKQEDKALAENKQQLPLESATPVKPDSVIMLPGSGEPIMSASEQPDAVIEKLPAAAETGKDLDIANQPGTFSGTGTTASKVTVTDGNGTLDYSKMTATGGTSNAAGNYYNPGYRNPFVLSDSISTFKNGDGYFLNGDQGVSASQEYKSINNTSGVIVGNATTETDKSGAYIDGNLIRTDDDVINTYDWAAAEKKKEERKEEKSRAAEADKLESEKAAMEAKAAAESKAAARKKAEEQLARLAEEGRMKAEADSKAKLQAEKKASEEASKLAEAKRVKDEASAKAKADGEQAARKAAEMQKASTKAAAVEETAAAYSPLKVADDSKEVAQAREDVEEQALNKAENKNAEGKAEDKKVYAIAEQMPEYPGGVEALKKYIAQNIKYPPAGKEMSVSGTVYVSYVVSSTGKVTDVKVSKGVNEVLDKEAVRVVSGVKGYVAGKQDGKPVNVLLSIPVKF